MLKMSTEDVIELNARDFAQYAMDKWGWSEGWTVSNAKYLEPVRRS
jgi:hypothetical protein